MCHLSGILCDIFLPLGEDFILNMKSLLKGLQLVFQLLHSLFWCSRTQRSPQREQFSMSRLKDLNLRVEGLQEKHILLKKIVYIECCIDICVRYLYFMLWGKSSVPIHPIFNHLFIFCKYF